MSLLRNQGCTVMGGGGHMCICCQLNVAGRLSVFLLPKNMHEKKKNQLILPCKRKGALTNWD